MKQYYKYALRCAAMAVLMLSALTFSACGDDEEGGNGSQSGQVDKKNKNANVPSAANGYNRAIQRTEFPALKQGGKQKVLVYRMKSTAYDKDGVNFSVEWDCNKHAIRCTADIRASIRVRRTSSSSTPRTSIATSIGANSNTSLVTTVDTSVRVATALHRRR